VKPPVVVVVVVLVTTMMAVVMKGIEAMTSNLLQRETINCIFCLPVVLHHG
jgi:hypothetical protein